MFLLFSIVYYLRIERAKSIGVENDKENRVIQASQAPVQIQATKSNPLSSANHNYIIDYEKELRLTEESTANANKIAEMEMERILVKASLEQRVQELERPEMQKANTQKCERVTALQNENRQTENSQAANPSILKIFHDQELINKCEEPEPVVTSKSCERLPMEEVQNLKTMNYQDGSCNNDKDCMQTMEIGDNVAPHPKSIGDAALKNIHKDVSEQKKKNQIPVPPIKGNAIPISKKSALKVTIPQPFKFSEIRARKIHETNTEQFKFKAKPAPLKILKGETAATVKPPPKTTQPLEMHFASEDRIRERNLKFRKSVPVPPVPTESGRKQESSISGLGFTKLATSDSCSASNSNLRSRTPNRTPMSNIRPRSQSSERCRPTHVQPFSFEERDKELQRKKQEKIRNAIKEDIKSTEFHAHPVPKFAKRLPPKHPAPVTTVKPFKFKCDERGMSYQQEFQRKVEEEAKSLKQQAEFLAQPNTTIYKKPFEPEKSNVPVPEPLDIVLHTDRRAPERHRFDHLIKEKEAELEELRRKEQMLKEEQEIQSSSALRQICVHKAKPAPKNRIFELKATEKPLTEPKSPAFELLPSQRRNKCTEN
ncbi:unnamed protein product [Allacma fusca]|uniref:TPX2 C-terminal domain-containing protein n=1 Tax=Allacma fusca TaxID=39272 RepID=A0A8J2PP63_9HEXA|nr:unnamed protein product [Allacma fusca]